MARFDSAIALAKKLIKKNGQVVTLRSIVRPAVPDANKPWEPGTASSSDASVDAVFLDYAQKFIDGQTVLMGDQRVFMPAYSTTDVLVDPKIDGVVIRGTETWRIINKKPLNPNGQAIMFELQVRQ